MGISPCVDHSLDSAAAPPEGPRRALQTLGVPARRRGQVPRRD
jgi:hypothetical protein